jgi:3-phenylpropionate/cinnamic acid dioxygenase small subunit
VQDLSRTAFYPPCDNDSMSTDLLDIERLLYDYAWACDERDWTLLRSVFTDDAELDYSSTGGPAGGRDEVVAWLESSLSSIRIQHVVSNFRIDVTDDRAAGKTMFLAILHLPGMDQPLTTGGYYDLSFVRGDGRWKIRRLYEDNRWMHPAPDAVS